MESRITNSYLHKLQAIYHKIDARGICIDPERHKEARIFIDQEITRNLKIASDQWGCHVFIGADNKDNSEGEVNLNATQGEKQLLKKLQDLGYKVPKIAKKNEEGDYESKYSTGELALQKMLVANQFNYSGGDPAIRAILQVRELGKLKSSYFNCRLYRNTSGNLLYLSNYNAAGTTSGRRSSRKHTFGYGNNAQNFPKHGKLAKTFRRCLVARPGNIFLMVDQKSAEEWPVSALSANMRAINEMLLGVNRHIRRASSIFGIPESSRTEKQWKDSLEYYLGKKTGHANNYGMRERRMSDSLAQEGHSIKPEVCAALLAKLNLLEPEIDGVFHKYVKDQINTSRILRTPFGRERQFLGLRPNDSNYKIFNEAYAYIPQSVVGDNTGFAISCLEMANCQQVVQEGHDSIVQDIVLDPASIWENLSRTVLAFDREIRFHNGIVVNIPIEAELGFDFNETVKIKDLSYDGVLEAYKKILLIREEEIEKENEKRQQQTLQDLASSIGA
jgi:DNA polymerase I-like protein with 3'-5' exonuclease and polymerase domains